MSFIALVDNLVDNAQGEDQGHEAGDEAESDGYVLYTCRADEKLASVTIKAIKTIVLAMPSGLSSNLRYAVERRSLRCLSPPLPLRPSRPGRPQVS